MQRSLSQRVQNYINDDLRRRRWQRIITALACIVVFCTTYALILPAITATGETYCGSETHTHSREECYERILICEDEQSGGTVHQHTDDCYETRSALICQLTEGEGHTHFENCYGEDGNLICGQIEAEAHNHDDSCYTTEEYIVCSQEKTGETVETHVHTESCYEERMICQLEEHEHSLICYSNSEADVESAAAWERTIPQSLGDNWAENVVAVAKSQLGYTESTANYEVDENNDIKGYTRYGAWYGIPYGDWCAMFASFCLHYAGIPEDVLPYSAVCNTWVGLLQEAELFESAADCYPETGFLIFFDTDSDGLADHVGIVTEVAEDGETVSTIEGNSGDVVAMRSYLRTDSSILGYCVLPKNPDAQEVETVSENDIAMTALDEDYQNSEELQLTQLADSERIIAGNYDLIYNDVKDCFLTDASYSKYYNAGSPLGTAGSFHIVAFGQAWLNAHTNGNVLAKDLYANSNFGTNNLPDELSYVQNYLQVNSVSAAKAEHLLAFGSSNAVEIVDNGNAFSINGRKNDRPYHLVQDRNTDTAPFIDLARVETEIAQIAATMRNYRDANLTYTSAQETGTGRSKLYLDKPSGVGVVSYTASELQTKLGDYVQIDGFESGHDGTVIINVDCSGVNTVNMPQARVVIDGQEQSTSEVTEFYAGKVIWNFLNADGVTINTHLMTGAVIAPGATVNIQQNLNGTVVAENINVNAESHRTDFTGKIEDPDEDPEEAYVLPETGGTGTLLFTIGGTLLLAGGLYIFNKLFFHRKKGI